MYEILVKHGKDASRSLACFVFNVYRKRLYFHGYLISQISDCQIIS